MNKDKIPYKYRENAPNRELRNYMKERGVCQWQLADRLGVTEYTLIKRLRSELPEYTKNQYLSIIDAIAIEYGLDEGREIITHAKMIWGIGEKRIIASLPKGSICNRIKQLATLYPNDVEITEAHLDGSIIANFPKDWLHISTTERKAKKEE